jgi:hypothetical protein
MKLAILVALLALVSPSFADPTSLSGELDTLTKRIAALAKLDLENDKQAKAALETINKDFARFIGKFHLAYKAALPKRARMSELNDEIGMAEELVDRPQSDDDRKTTSAKLKALHAERDALKAELEQDMKQRTNADRDRELAYKTLHLDVTKQRVKLLEANLRTLGPDRRL